MKWHTVLLKIKWATSWENLFIPYANNKDADQPAHPRSLISVFVVRCLDSLFTCSFKTLASLWSWSGRFESYLVANPEDRFSRVEAQIILDSLWWTFWCLVQSWEEQVSQKYFPGWNRKSPKISLFYPQKRSFGPTLWRSVNYILAHLSLKAHVWAESVGWLHCPSSTLFRHLLLRNCWVNQSQISYGASMGLGNESLFKWSWSYDQDGRHAHVW